MNQIDKAALKELVKEILVEDVWIFKDIIREVLLEHQIIVSEEQAKRRQRLEAMIEEDFDKYDSVFRDLA